MAKQLLKKINNPKITVAVAIYRVENGYLKQCVDSILGQTFSDIEVLLIGDNTNQQNIALMKEYEKQDERVRVILNERNKGLPGVRNQAFNYAHGEYLTFVDNDDWLDRGILEKAYIACMDHHMPDMAVWTYNVVIDGSISKTNYIGPEQKLFKGKNKKKIQLQVLDATFGNGDLQLPMFVTAWAKLYKMDFINEHPEIRFPEKLVSGGEDFPFNYRIINEADGILLLGEYGYYYRRHEGSMTANMVGNIWNKRCQWMDETDRVVDHSLILDDIAYRRYCLNQALAQMISLFDTVEDDGNHTGRPDRKTLNVIRDNKHISIALSSVHSLGYRKTKVAFYLLLKFRLMIPAMIICKKLHAMGTE